MRTVVKRFKRLWTMILNYFVFVAFADGEPTPQPTDPAPNPTPTPNPQPTPNPEPTPSGSVNFEDLVAKARREEREKLYPEIEKWKNKHNNLLLVVAERDKTITELQSKIKDLESEVSKLKETADNQAATGNAELLAQISTLEATIEQMKTQHASELEKKDLEIYRINKLAEVGTTNLIPELVSGNTKEEIDASIERAKQRYQEILQAANKGVSYPPANPASSAIKLDKTPEEIARMTPQEWAEYRKMMGLK